MLLTGATDGIGLETARMLVQQGHHVLLHGRNAEKLENVRIEFATQGAVESYIADLSDMASVLSLADKVSNDHDSIDVLINNAGVLKAPQTITNDGFDIRFAVNTIAPYLLTKKLLPLLSKFGRIINLSSAAQAPVDLDALKGNTDLADMEAYSQSKLAITMWSNALAQALPDGPVIISVNPGSLLGSKMVKEGFGIAGHDISIGAEILTKLSINSEFSDKTGQYFDNDKGQFSSPHQNALDKEKCRSIMSEMEQIRLRLEQA
ncbi:MAG: SDR family NAD(P)-dependent oxidoreductase [Alphaproteobacteria bacterium]|nr:SDR family NAD(P)-dependent oxidoreductase [Alphaproteobacteria bacterium]